MKNRGINGDVRAWHRLFLDFLVCSVNYSSCCCYKKCRVPWYGSVSFVVDILPDHERHSEVIRRWRQTCSRSCLANVDLPLATKQLLEQVWHIACRAYACGATSE